TTSPTGTGRCKRGFSGLVGRSEENQRPDKRVMASRCLYGGLRFAPRTRQGIARPVLSIGLLFDEDNIRGLARHELPANSTWILQARLQRENIGGSTQESSSRKPQG